MIDNYILYSNLPSIDLHGMDRVFALIKVKEFILDNYNLNNKLILIIHGKGSHILKNEVHKYLKTNNLVLSYKIDLFNDGVTVVELK